MLSSFIKINSTAFEFINSDDAKNYGIFDGRLILCQKDQNTIIFHNDKWYIYEPNKNTDLENYYNKNI